jgi:hypothetical protein
MLGNMTTNRFELKAGLRIGSLVLSCGIEGKSGNVTKWECNCDCGHKSEIHVSTLSQGLIRHCENCRTKRARRQTTAKKRERHGLGKGDTYISYSKMISRVYNPRHTSYKQYGCRGLTVCDRWLESYLNFLEDMGERPKGMTLERIDNKKGYSPDNCKWASRKEQQRNRRNTLYVNFNGEKRKLIELIEEENNQYESVGSKYRLTYNLVYSRIRAGWAVKKALMPIRK